MCGLGERWLSRRRSIERESCTRGEKREAGEHLKIYFELRSAARSISTLLAHLTSFCQPLSTAKIILFLKRLHLGNKIEDKCLCKSFFLLFLCSRFTLGVAFARFEILCILPSPVNHPQYRDHGSGTRLSAIARFINLETIANIR